ncbi:MAG: Ribonuclease H1 [Alectoria fallacina]|uniref:ribonuclease H n=1 Tax=Alectoria fallacina TaxID=1903189 RepID=A0A8H3G2E1_9LECA|nr:MAG: Ribonuclease H1 [Alectoria fallacina]
MHGQPQLDDQTAPPFKDFFICDHIFCRQEFELQFAAVLGLDFLQDYFVRTQWTETGWAIQLPPPITGRIEELIIYTDGCCLSNGQVVLQGSNVSSPQGRYGIHFPSLPNGWDIHSALSRDKINTNQRAELTAVIRALQIVRRRGLLCGRIVLFTDSDYAVQGLNEWIPRWRQRGYRTSKNRGVVNADLFRLLDQEASLSRENGVPVKITHVLRESNQRADALSKLGATSSGKSEMALRKIDLRGFGGILGRPLMEETKPLIQWSPDSACWVSTQMEDGGAEGRNRIMVDATD